MKNFQMSFKKFLTNKNTVTILGVLLAIVVLYVGYNMRIKKLTNPVNVPYAIQNIAPRTKITSEMIGTIQVPPSMIKGNPYMDSKYLIGKYVNVESTIPKGSLFYASSVVDAYKKYGDSIIIFTDYYEIRGNEKVYTNLNLKIKRICHRDNIDEETARKRLKIQQTNEYYIQKSDFIIENLEECNLEKEVEKIFEKISK